MQSKAKDVATYLETVPPGRRAALTKLRELCLSLLIGYEECMDYGMPGYKKKGTVEVGFASQKNYISLYILKVDAVKANRAFLKGLDIGKGCIRYPNPDKIDFNTVKKLLVTTRKLKSPIC